MSIYKDINATDEISPTRSIIYEGTCDVCGSKIKGRKCDLLKTKTCRHPNVGNVSIQYSQITSKSIMYIFEGMVKRCYKPYCKEYKWYGAKGITICNNWLSSPCEFQKWIEGELFKHTGSTEWKRGLSVDRVDSSQSYSPENCRLLPIGENAALSKAINAFDVDGIVLSGRAWAKKLGVYPGSLNYIKRKYGYDAAVAEIRRRLDTNTQVA